MIMKIPTSPIGNGCYEPYDLEDDLDIPSDFENDNDFSEYLWMENEEEFDKMEMQRLEEEELMKECIEAMLEDELEAEYAFNEESGTDELCDVLSSLTVTATTQQIPAATTTTAAANVENSTLNPLAAEFVPAVSLVLPASTT